MPYYVLWTQDVVVWQIGDKMNVEFDVQMSVSALYDYNMHHTYTGTSGIVGTVFGAMLLILYAAYNRPYYLIAGLIVILYIPIELYFKSLKQVKLNPMFKNSIHYEMSDEGIRVSQGEQEIMIDWDGIVKAQSTNQSLLLYTSKASAIVFPKKDLGEKRYDVIEAISTHMPPAKVKIKQ